MGSVQSLLFVLEAVNGRLLAEGNEVGGSVRRKRKTRVDESWLLKDLQNSA